jgi:hypothetical protein
MNETLFDKDFQNLFISYMLRDTTFLQHVANDIQPTIFGDEYRQRICRLVLDFYEREKAAPQDLIFHQIDDLYQQNLITESLQRILSTYIDDLFAVELHNRNYVLKEFDRFIRHQTFRANILPLNELIKAGKFEEAEELVQKTFLKKSTKDQDEGRLLDPDPTKRIARRRTEDQKRLWWLVPEIDRRIRGMKAGELGVLQSQRSSGGKSAGLAFLARQYAFQGKKILIFTLEMSEEDYEDRLDMCISGLVSSGLTDHTRIAMKLNKITKRGGAIWIKQFPGQLTRISDLRRYKQHVEQTENFHADVVIVDYADELVREKKSRADSSFDIGKEIYSHLRGWAVKEKIVAWTGMQSNRSAGETDVADMEQSGESIAKAWIADLIISINRTKKEAEEGVTRLHIVKNRTGVARFTLTVKTDFSKMQFIVPEWKDDDIEYRHEGNENEEV